MLIYFYYIDSINKFDVKVLTRSRWFNSIVVGVNEEFVIEQIRNISFVKSISKKSSSLQSDVPDKFNAQSTDVTTDFSAKNKQRLLEIIRNRGKNRIFCWMNGFLNQLILIKHMHLPTTIWWHNVY